MDINIQERVLNYLRENNWIDDSGYGSLVHFEYDEYPAICEQIISYIEEGMDLEDCINCFIEDCLIYDWRDDHLSDALYEIKSSIMEELSFEDEMDFDILEDEILELLRDRISIYPTYEDVYNAIKDSDLYIYLALDTGDYNCEFTPNGDIIQCIHDREFEDIDEDDVIRSSLVWLLNQHSVSLKDVDLIYHKVTHEDGFKRDKNSIVHDIAWEICNTVLYRICKVFYKIKMKIEDYVKLKSFWYGSKDFFEDNKQLSGNYLSLPKDTVFGFGDDGMGWASITEATLKKDINVPLEMVHNIFIEQIDWKVINNPYDLGLAEIDNDKIKNFSKVIERGIK